MVDSHGTLVLYYFGNLQMERDYDMMVIPYIIYDILIRHYIHEYVYFVYVYIPLRGLRMGNHQYLPFLTLNRILDRDFFVQALGPTD